MYRMSPQKTEGKRFALKDQPVKIIIDGVLVHLNQAWSVSELLEALSTSGVCWKTSYSHIYFTKNL